MEKLPIATPTGTQERRYAHNANDEETVFFHLQDATHEFTMGLKDILKCVKIAEKKGMIPALPKMFWHTMASHYIEFREYYKSLEDED